MSRTSFAYEGIRGTRDGLPKLGPNATILDR